ncbi:aminotransferase class IV family protein [Rhizobium sp. TRM95796]|uniref:aminotransferase class IV family protein n=1 Tax=Rhizobium sp. TRM95796 TaxID=2979862 RepID=UPI0021E7EAE5|nr:aminotransferase class IV family protein [Rhizobium sp. TRM95796]MCV3766104.1 aminotransferase class IV family protein [Rhizobium sp. TRM95796]
MTQTPDFSLIETMRAEPGAGIVRGKLHQARFHNSTRKLGFAKAEAAWKALDKAASAVDAPTRLRLEFWPDGRFEIQSAGFTPLPIDAVWTLRIATSAHLASNGPLLRHKTSRRTVYDAARADYSREDADEVLLLNEKGEVCEGTITNLFVTGDDGDLLTPPLSSGCLAGVLRTSLICARKARVQTLRPGDLVGRTLYVGNSLRGLIAGRLQS